MTGATARAIESAPLHPADLRWISPAIEGEDGTEAAHGISHAFRVGARWFFIPMGLPAEVEPATAVARLPYTAPWCLGLANIRGALAPVYDLNRLMGADPSGRLFLIIGQRDARACLVIDEITVVTLPLNARQIAPPPLPNLPDGLPITALELRETAYIQIDLSGLLRALAQQATLV